MMWMYGRFLSQNGGRSFLSMIPESSTINQRLFAILGDTRHLSLFSSDEIVFILMHHGLMVRLIRGICGTNVNRNTHGRIMWIIMNRVMRYAISHRSCNSRIQLVVKNFYARVYQPINISFFLNLIVVLPKPQAILHMSSSGLSDNQMESYKIVALIALFSELTVEKNGVFSLFCNFAMEEEKSESAIRFRQFERDFRQARGSRDYTLFKRYFEFISEFLFSEIRHPKHSEIRWCLDIVYLFLTKMKNSSNNDWQFFAEVFESKTAADVLSLLENGCEPFSYRQLGRYREPFALKFTLPYPPNGTSNFARFLRRNISQALEKAYSFRVPQHLSQILERLSDTYLINITMSKGSRLLFLLCTFIEFVQSNHPHIGFLVESYVYMETNQHRHLDQLLIFLNVGHAQESELQGFDRLLYHVCRFSNRNANFSDVAERNFVELFDFMIRILSNNNFLVLLSELLSNDNLIDDLSNLLSYKISGSDFISSFWHFQYPGFVNRISACRNIYCSECDALLPPDRVEMCEICAICMHNHHPDDEDGW
ncbi:MAG: hypothetical protein NT038_10540 [Euryarchaeota archaeon]|nr:hypothetical protein [Euryarchaeota archaeon]